ncbi:uncharacterized protein LALA0_S01e12552g [Lachancea lanzarotensis]|uniref:LALA0S01e12552g1_1 n=1 Tax=Lachancea lanzarotensis TaxID=1245769 RepID=A0A0C7N1U6_9SACH|nr:uncharacterized protein LALA0_S01e12552g [Lachancea lanzarotensis]CEP60509.1 LALA0S01e12552g1_1 [Lachancea lanzarotensis]
MTSSKKQPQNSGDRTWSVVNFDRNGASQRSDGVSIQTVLEEGLCDDVLSTASSDESDSLIAPSNDAVATGYGFSTLIEQKEDLAKTLSHDPVLSSSLAPENTTVCSRAGRGLAQLNPWQIVLLTSSTTFLITCTLQALLNNPSPTLVNDVATAPYFTNHGATYRNVDFVLPPGAISEGAGKFIVDFENRIAHPIVPEVTYWESAKSHIGGKSRAFLSHVKELDKYKLLNVKNKVQHANIALLSAVNRSFSSCSMKFRSAADQLSYYKQAIGLETKDQFSRLEKKLEKAWQDQVSGHLFPLRDKITSYVTKTRSSLSKGGPLVLRCRSTFFELATGIDQFRDRTGSVIVDKWDNTMAMLRFKANDTQN